MIRRTWTALVLALAVALIASSCSSGSDTDQAEPTTVVDPTPGATTDATAEPTTPPAPTEPPEPTIAPTTPTAEPSATATSTPDAGSTVQTVRAYWLSETSIAVGGRILETSSPARAALDVLLQGPNQREQELGMATALPDGVDVLGLTIADGRAVVDLSGELESVSFGTSGELAMVAQIVFTLTQFRTVDSVDIWIDGVERDAILSHGLEARDLTRSSLYDAVAPAIVVESPFPDEEVWGPFLTSGFSRTFESNVQWELTHPPGETVIASGFTTAEQPDVGVHGPFNAVVLEDAASGSALLSVFEESAEDGSRINVYDVPITLLGTEPEAAEDPLPWLKGSGLGPIDFGASIDQTTTALLETLDEPDDTTVVPECGVGEVTQVSWDGLTLLFLEDLTFAGWFYESSEPSLTTRARVAPGSPIDQLVSRYAGVDVFSDTLGPEFSWETPDGFIGGFLTEDGETITALYAGATCFFR